ncbi:MULTISPECIES: TMEM175 family protein [unclassified Pseudonocardia]|uniref:TMEM175 family protein n=1 Tax=unclassified Pseudonocardia TaxID=2619320 RepID=UPI001CF6D35D|nr:MULTISPECIES: TMEM175 family protein [unclassified Pseudonocardia]
MRRRVEVGLERITFFSDGVFAIAITLLVLPLTDAEIGPGPVAPQLVELLPRMLTFALSFAVIGRYWTVHHQLFARFDRADARMMTLNLGYLFGIAFLPFPTSLLGGHGDSTAAVVLYAANLVVIGSFSAAMWAYGSYRGRLTRADVTPDEARHTLVNGLAPVVSFLPSLVIAPLSPTWAMLSWLLTVPVSAVAERLFPEHRAARARAGAGTPDTA